MKLPAFNCLKTDDGNVKIRVKIGCCNKTFAIAVSDDKIDELLEHAAALDANSAPKLHKHLSRKSQNINQQTQ